MPELPEAETIARALAPVLEGQRLGKHGVLQRVWRYGKCVLFEFGAERMVVRLGMTGSLRLDAEPGRYTREIFEFERSRLLFNDIRTFGRIEWSREMPRLGPDVLTLSAEHFGEMLRERKRQIKALLLDQSFVSGLGNIYADECLHRAGVDPRTSAAAVDGKKLLGAIVETLGEAIVHGGSTISDFVDPYGKQGRFKDYHRVYGREGQPCQTCGGNILRMVVAQRGTHYCPQCQPTSRLA